MMPSNPSRGWIVLISAEGRRAKLPDFISYIQLQSSGTSHTSTPMTGDLTVGPTMDCCWLGCESHPSDVPHPAGLSGWETWGRWGLWDSPLAICINPLMWQWHGVKFGTASPCCWWQSQRQHTAASLSWAPTHNSHASAELAKSLTGPWVMHGKEDTVWNERNANHYV